MSTRSYVRSTAPEPDPAGDVTRPTTPTPDYECECESLVIDECAVARARAATGDGLRVKALTDIFGALGEPTRLRIVVALAAGPLCVCDLAAVTRVTQSAVSHQLRVLRDLDLVAYTREGRRAVYRLADGHVEALLSQGGEHAEERLRGARS